MTKRRLFAMLALVICVLSVSACGESDSQANTATPESVESQEEALDSAKPEPSDTPVPEPSDTPFPTETPQPTDTPAPPTPEPTTGQVKGVLVEDSENPVAEQALRLPMAEEVDGETTFHFEDDSPITETDSSGEFLFEEVPPGRYALAAFLPFPTFLEGATGATIVFEVVAGDVVDLGTIPMKTQ